MLLIFISYMKQTTLHLPVLWLLLVHNFSLLSAFYYTSPLEITERMELKYLTSKSITIQTDYIIDKTCKNFLIINKYILCLRKSPSSLKGLKPELVQHFPKDPSLLFPWNELFFEICTIHAIIVRIKMVS